MDGPDDVGSPEPVDFVDIRRAPMQDGVQCHSVHHICGRKQGVPDAEPFKHDEVVVYNDGPNFQV